MSFWHSRLMLLGACADNRSMRVLHLLGATAASLAVVGPAVPAAAADPTVLGTTTRATVVGAAGGWTAWSDASGRTFALVVRAPDGTVSRPGVAPRGVPFDVDLGTDAAGRVVATYSRCAREPQAVGGANATAPQWASGRGCRLYRLDLASGAEKAFAPPKGGESQVLPSLSGSTLAYVRVARRPHGRAALMARDLRSKRTRRLQHGAIRGGSVFVAGGPASVDTDGARVAAIWRYEDREFHDFNATLLVTPVRGGRTKQVAYGVNNDVCNYNSLVGTTVSGGTVEYLRTNGSQWQTERTSASREVPGRGSSTTTYGPFMAGEDVAVTVTSAVVDGNRLVVASTVAEALGTPKGPTQIQELALGAFVKKAPEIGFCD